MYRRNRAKKNTVLFCFLMVILAGIITASIIIGIQIGRAEEGKVDLVQSEENTLSEDAVSSDIPSSVASLLDDPTKDIIIKNETSSASTPDKAQWNLILVNKWNLLPEGHDPTLAQLVNGQSIDERAYPDLQDMMDDCRSEGLQPLICSSYRTMEKQIRLFKNKVSEYLSQGYSQEKAEEAAGELVAIPGTSEHQLGLALDIVDVSNQLLDESQENTPVQKWLMQNSWKYGFILRYPNDKSEITGISYEPWHYRYVGKEAAKEIYESGICLEEYLEGYFPVQ